MIKILSSEETRAFMARHPEITQQDIIDAVLSAPAGQAAGLHVEDSGHTYLLRFDSQGVLRILDLTASFPGGQVIPREDEVRDAMLTALAVENVAGAYLAYGIPNKILDASANLVAVGINTAQKIGENLPWILGIAVAIGVWNLTRRK